MMDQKDSNSQNRWIASIELRNFQLHKDTFIEFSPGLNVITGSNHRGKSTIMRAIQYLTTSRPTTEVDGLVRWGKKSFFIKMTMSDGSWVIREKGKDINQYTVFDARKSGDAIKLTGFGTSVPPEVSETLGMGLVSFGTKKNIFLNMASQDEVFLIEEGETEMARWMYSITHLHDIRGAMDQATKECKQMADQIKDSSDRINLTQKKLDEMPDIDMMMMAVNDRAVEKERISECLSEVSDMENLLGDMVSLKKKAIPVKMRIESKRELLDDIVPIISSIEDDELVLRELIGIRENVSRIETEIQEIRSRSRILIQKTRIDISDPVKEAEIIGEMISVLQDIRDSETSLSKANSMVKRSGQKKAELLKEMSELESEMFGDERTCPFCGQEVGEDLVEHIVSEVGE